MRTVTHPAATVPRHRHPVRESLGDATCRNPLVLSLVSASSGIVAYRWMGGSASLWLAAAAFLWLAWRVVHHRQWAGTSQCLLLLAVAGLYGGRYGQSTERILPNDLGHLAMDAAHPVAVVGQVQTEPKRIYADATGGSGSVFPRGDRTRFDLHPTAIRDGEVWRPVSGQTRVVVEGHLPGIRAGDRIQLLGDLRRPSEAMNPGQFSHYDYEKTRGCLSRLSVDHPQAITLVKRASAWNARWWLPRWRGALSQVLARYLEPADYGLADAILLGGRENLDEECVQAFFLTGTIHVLAISGMHVGILAAGFWGAARLQWMPQRWTWHIVIVVTIGYALIVGAQAPVMRATVLIVILCLGELRREMASSWNTLAAAALVVLAVQPQDLFQTGALLSFLAVAALVVFAPREWGHYPEDPLDRLLLKARPRWQRMFRSACWKLARMFAATLAVWCTVLPLVVHQFHIVTPIGLLLNLLLFIPVCVALFSGLGVLLFAWLLPPLAQLAAWGCTASLRVLQWSVTVCEDVPYGHTWWVGPPVWGVWCFYFGLACVFLLASFRQRWAGLAVLMTAYAVLAHTGVGRSDRDAASLPRTHATFLSVGHGLCVAIELPDNELWLYDAGALGDPRYTCDTVARFLWHRGYRRIDRIIVSHADADHYNAVPGLVERFEVGEVCMAGKTQETRDEAFLHLRERLQAKLIPVRLIHAGDVLADHADYRIGVLHPPPDQRFDGDNAHSIVLSVECGGQTLLLTGDLELDGLEHLMGSIDSQCEIALVPHHGSMHSHPRKFARWCGAKHLVVSGGQNSLGLLDDPFFRSSAIQVLHTARHGAVHAVLGGSQVEVDVFRRELSMAPQW